MLDLICAYENYLTKVKQASGNTISSYMRDIRQFADWLHSEQETEVVEASQQNISAFMDHLEDQGRSGATKSRALASLKNFYSYLLSSGFIDETPVQQVSVKRDERKYPQVLTGQEIDLLLKQPSENDAKGIRDKAMLQMMYATGLRVSELLGLDMDHVNLDQGFIRCCGGKKPRLIPLSQNARIVLRRYIAEFRAEMLANPAEQALFVNVSGVRMSRQGFWKILKHYKDEAGISKEITPHTLRHSFAIRLLENGTDLGAIQELMGHSDISSTQMYTQMLENRRKQLGTYSKI